MTSSPGPEPSPAGLPAPLVARTVAVDDPGPLLSLLPGTDARDVVSWVRGGSGWANQVEQDCASERRSQELRAALRGIQRELGITALFVTHDQDEAAALADRIVVLERGCVVSER